MHLKGAEALSGLISSIFREALLLKILAFFTAMFTHAIAF